MSRGSLGSLALIGLALAAASVPAAAPAATSFDCAKARAGTIAPIICDDPRLVELDRELARLDRLAMNGVPADRQAELVEGERAWLARRDRCVDAPDPVRCATLDYARRITEIRRSFAPARDADDAGISLGPFVFACEAGGSIVATFLRTDLPFAYMKRGDQEFLTELQRSGSGARYAGDGLSFWDKGGRAMVTLPDGTETICTTG